MATVNYTPPPTVRDFVKHYKPGELFMDFILGPVGSGKTTGIFFKLAYLASLQAKSPIDGIRRSRAVVVRNTAPQLNDTTLKSWDYWFKDGQAGKWYATNKTFVLKYGDVECEVLFRPLDTADDVQRVLSLEVTFAILDEFVQIPQAIVEALSARCGRYPPAIEGGCTNWGLWGASNPGMETDWWYPMLEDHDELPEGTEPPVNWTYFKQPSGFADAAENTDNLPGGRDYYNNLCKGKTKHWIKQFIEVTWGYSMDGKPVFPEFNPDIHVSKVPLKANPAWPLIVGYDPGMTGSGGVLMQYDEHHGRLMVLRELVQTGYATDRFISERLKPMLRSQFPGAQILVVADPASGQRSSAKTGSSTVEEFKKAKIPIKADGNNEIESRIKPAQYYMMRLTAVGPALILDPSCVKLKRALVGGYKYVMVRTTDEAKEVPLKNGHSHIADAFTYGCRYVRKGEEMAGRTIERPRRYSGTRNSYNMR
jgi:hypothetical protein